MASVDLGAVAPIKGPLAPSRAGRLGCGVPGLLGAGLGGAGRPLGANTAEQVGAWLVVALLEVTLSALSRVPCKLLHKPSGLQARARNISSSGRSGPRAASWKSRALVHRDVSQSCE